MIGSLTRSAALTASLAIPRRGPPPAQSVIVAGKPTKLSVGRPMQARAILPTELARVPALPPMPSSRPVVQAGRPIPALSPSAPLTSLAPPFYAAPSAGTSVVSVDPPGDLRLPSPMPFGTAAFSTVDPIYPEDFDGEDPVFPDNFGPEPQIQPTRVSGGAVVPAPARPSVTKAPSHTAVVGALVGLALLGGVGVALYARRKR